MGGRRFLRPALYQMLSVRVIKNYNSANDEWNNIRQISDKSGVAWRLPMHDIVRYVHAAFIDPL